MPERQCLRKTLEQSAGTEPCKEGCEGFEGAELHTQGGPRRRPALARARQGRRIIHILTTSGTIYFPHVWLVDLGCVAHSLPSFYRCL